MQLHPLIQSLYQIGAIKFGDFTLKSGQNSRIYLDLRRMVSYPDILKATAEAMWEKIQKCQFDLICGIPYTALPIATCISLLYNQPMILRRKEKKAYGTKQQVEGSYSSGQTCLLIEDVITTGSSILETAGDLETLGLKIKDLAVLIDRGQGGKENLTKKNYHVHAVFTLQEILQNLLESNLLTPTEQEIVAVLIHELFKNEK